MCGKTDHFTNFAILLGGGISGGKKGQCDESSDRGYILGNWENDLILTASVIGAVIVIGIVIIVATSFGPLKRLLYGKEGARILQLRSAKDNFSERNNYYDDDD